MPNNPTSRLIETPDDTEASMLDQRRADGGLDTMLKHKGRPLYRALALSGGGIRSATFALGVLQAMCKPAAPGPNDAPGSTFRNTLLARFDYLSTVSGGGYVGAFLCSLFVPGRLRATDTGTASKPAQPATPDDVLRAADDAARVLGSGAPGRIRMDDSLAGEQRLRAPLAWLRENGRYLIPTGVGDAFYAGALGIRNWFALHYVIGTVLVALLSLVTWLRTSAHTLESIQAWDDGAMCRALHAYAPQVPRTLSDCGTIAVGQAASFLDWIWWSPLFPGAAAILLVLGVPLGVAFWQVGERPDGKSRIINFNMACTAALAIALAVLAGCLWTDYVAELLKYLPWHLERFIPGKVVPLVLNLSDPATRRFLVVLVMAVVAALAVVVYAVTAIRWHGAAMQRVKLTRGLSYVIAFSVAVAFIALIDTLGQTLYMMASYSGAPGSTVLGTSGLTGVLVWLAKKLAAKAPDAKAPSWIQRVPLYTLAGIAGVLIFVLVGSLWGMLIHWFLYGGEPPVLAGPVSVAWSLGWIVTGTAVLAAVTALFPAFVNLSSLQPFYGSRLTRAYLGASNGVRYATGRAALSAAEPLPGDEIALEAYLQSDGKRLSTFAPLHIINVTVNKTVDPAEQLVQRDRKGQPMAVLPTGFSIDRHWYTGFPKSDRLGSPSSRPMGVGQWIGTSGAAFSTGIGRETSLGMSLLMGAANVRLGTWWESGIGGSPVTLASLPLRALGAVFRTQTYLSYELRARFFGTRRRWQYLSDGGHFENTGIYELLRKRRRVAQIFACDNGADPDFRFEDLANLIRLVRIDLQVELVVETQFNACLAKVFSVPEAFKRPAAGASVNPDACALMLWATHPGCTKPSTQIILLKPSVGPKVPADVLQYAQTHDTFPQQTTADQFFDEAQWESYRALGYHIAERVLTPDVLYEIDKLACEKIPLDQAAPTP
jgi:hypothetical protein